MLVNKYKLIKLVLLFILFVVILMWTFYNFNKPPVQNLPKDQVLIDSSEDVGEGSIHLYKKEMDYKKALELYKGSYIELSLGTCKANPNNVTYKSGTDVMIDNRAPEERTIKLGNTYSIKGYGFKIIKFSSTTLPIKFNMHCAGEENVGLVTLQN